MPRQQLGHQSGPDQASQPVNQPASATARTFFSSGYNLEALESDESIQMSEGNPPQFVVCEKKGKGESQDTRCIDSFQETEELPTQDTHEPSKEIDKMSTEKNGLPVSPGNILAIIIYLKKSSIINDSECICR